MRPTPPSFAGGLALILEKGSDGKFVAKSGSCYEKCTFLPGQVLNLEVQDGQFS
jgi:hypothetical protein